MLSLLENSILSVLRNHYVGLLSPNNHKGVPKYDTILMFIDRDGTYRQSKAVLLFCGDIINKANHIHMLDKIYLIKIIFALIY